MLRHPRCCALMQATVQAAFGQLALLIAPQPVLDGSQCPAGCIAGMRED
jgi:hypothetical protein